MGAGDTMIRAARSDELALLQTLEQAAGAPFRELAMHAIADDQAPSLEGLAAFVQAGEHGLSLMPTTLPSPTCWWTCSTAVRTLSRSRSSRLRSAWPRCSAARPRGHLGAAARSGGIDPDHVHRRAMERALLRAAWFPAPMRYRADAGPASRPRS